MYCCEVVQQKWQNPGFFINEKFIGGKILWSVLTSSKWYMQGNLIDYRYR